MPKTRLLLVWEEEGRRDAGPKRDSEVRCFPWVRIQQNTNRKIWTILTNIIILKLVAKKGKKGRERERERQSEAGTVTTYKQSKDKMFCSSCMYRDQAGHLGFLASAGMLSYSYLSFLQILLPV